MLTNPQAVTFQKINIAVYHQHKSDKIDYIHNVGYIRMTEAGKG